MEELNLQVPHGFGLNPRSVIKHKLFYICNTDGGTKIIKRITPDSEKARRSILFQDYIKENLYALGYPFLDRFNRTLNNEPYLILDKSLYIMTDHLPFKEAHFSSADEFKRVVTNTAAMHALAKRIAPYDSIRGPQQNSAEALYHSSINKLAALKKSISKYRQLSDFDVLFYKNYDYYRACLDQWFHLITSSGFEEQNRRAAENSYLCHNLLKEENILINEETVYITNFSDCAYEYYLKDLALLIKRHFKVNTEHSLPIAEIIDIYHKNNPLTKHDAEMLYALLLFPDKFMKICTQYYAKKRTWIPGTFMARIEQTIQTKDIYMRYINGIYEEFLK